MNAFGSTITFSAFLTFNHLEFFINWNIASVVYCPRREITCFPTKKYEIFIERHVISQIIYFK